MNMFRLTRIRPLVPPPYAVTVPAPWAPERAAQPARDLVTGQVAHLAQAGSLDAGTGHVLDAYLDQLGRQWHTEVAADRTQRIAVVERQLAHVEAAAEAATRRSEVTGAVRQRTEREMAILERRILEPAEDQPNDRRERRRRPRPTLDPVEGLIPSPLHTALTTVLLLLAAGGDLVTFRLTLAAFTGSADWIVWVLTIAFAAVSVGLMHGAGRALKDLREARGGFGRVAIVLMVGAWTVLGGVATFFRTQVATPTSGPQSVFGVDTAAETAASDHEALLSAVLLAGLYLASGVLAFYAGFSEHHPQARTYRALRRRLRGHVADDEACTTEAGRLQRQLEHLRGEHDRIAKGAEAALDTADATIAELKELARVEIARHMGTPEATSGLIRAPHTPDQSRPDERGARPVPRPRPSPVRTTDAGLVDAQPLPALAGAGLGLWSSNGHSANGHSSNGHSSNGHPANGHPVDGAEPPDDAS